jgi:hypothetical protein
MNCQTCGLEYSDSHLCPGVPSTSAEKSLQPPSGFALWHYLGEALRIVCWNSDAIHRVKDDPRSLKYGAIIWLFSNSVPWLIYRYSETHFAQQPSWQIFSALAFTLVAALAWSLAQLGAVHLIARHFCAGDGTFLQILRPLSLASIVLLLQVLPILAANSFAVTALAGAGAILGFFLWIGVMVMVFDAVHGVEQLTTFIVSIVVGYALRFLLEFLVRNLRA